LKKLTSISAGPLKKEGINCEKRRRGRKEGFHKKDSGNLRVDAGEKGGKGKDKLLPDVLSTKSTGGGVVLDRRGLTPPARKRGKPALSAAYDDISSVIKLEEKAGRALYPEIYDFTPPSAAGGRKRS